MRAEPYRITIAGYFDFLAKIEISALRSNSDSFCFANLNRTIPNYMKGILLNSIFCLSVKGKKKKTTLKPFLNNRVDLILNIQGGEKLCM